MNGPTIIVLIGVLAGGVLLSEWTVKRRVINRMSSRRARTPNEFGQDLFPAELAPIATRIRDILARHLNIDLSRLSPDDTFAELEIAELDSLTTVEFVVDLEKEFAIKISDNDAARIKTVRDLVEFVADSTHQCRPPDKSCQVQRHRASTGG